MFVLSASEKTMTLEYFQTSTEWTVVNHCSFLQEAV